MSDINRVSTNNIPGDIVEKLKPIKLLAMDVDGILTNGVLYYSDQGELLKTFSIKDGLGIKLLQKHGVRTAIITGRRSAMVELRAEELGIEFIIQGREDKLIALKELSELADCTLDQIAYIGDDLPDLSAIICAGFGATVADANHEVKQRADWISERSGGDAAIRDLAELILNAQGNYATVLEEYLP